MERSCTGRSCCTGRSGAGLTVSGFAGVGLTGAGLTGAVLTGAGFSAACVDLGSGAGADLTGAAGLSSGVAGLAAGRAALGALVRAGVLAGADLAASRAATTPGPENTPGRAVAAIAGWPPLALAASEGFRLAS